MWIVAQEFSQIPSIDYKKTFSSVVKFTMLWIFLLLIAILNFNVHWINIIGAYLEENLDEEIYMKALFKIRKEKYWKLHKAIYGLKQGSWQWKQWLHKVLFKLSFKQTLSDDCLYIVQDKRMIILIVLVYVDNMAIARENTLDIINFKRNLSKTLMWQT